MPNCILMTHCAEKATSMCNFVVYPKLKKSCGIAPAAFSSIIS